MGTKKAHRSELLKDNYITCLLFNDKFSNIIFDAN